mmetsp:Transcript_13417/g.18590  ORF Transcript_13417/g.18590 Transcript_13417/m.18590 type:complete len:214 (+) Transcript_13417:212-853(+)
MRNCRSKNRHGVHGARAQPLRRAGGDPAGQPAGDQAGVQDRLAGAPSGQGRRRGRVQSGEDRLRRADGHGAARGLQQIRPGGRGLEQAVRRVPAAAGDRHLLRHLGHAGLRPDPRQAEPERPHLDLHGGDHLPGGGGLAHGPAGERPALVVFPAAHRGGARLAPARALPRLDERLPVHGRLPVRGPGRPAEEDAAGPAGAEQGRAHGAARHPD